MLAQELKTGDEFRTSTRQRKNYRVASVYQFKPTDKVSEETRGKLLIQVQGCGQVLLHPTDEVFAAKPNSTVPQWLVGKFHFPFLFACGTESALASHSLRMYGETKESTLTMHVKYPCGAFKAFCLSQVGIDDEAALNMACVSPDRRVWYGLVAAELQKLTFAEFMAALEKREEPEILFIHAAQPAPRAQTGELVW